jgi:hypothetical protein
MRDCRKKRLFPENITVEATVEQTAQMAERLRQNALLSLT